MLIFDLIKASSKVVLAMMILLTASSVGRAQNPNWGKWQNPGAPTGHEDDPEWQKPGHQPYPGTANCPINEEDLINRQAHWVCRRDSNCVGGFCWWGVSDATYKCPEGKYMHVMEWVRYTKVPCGKKDWEQTQYDAGQMGETWAGGDGPTTDPGTRATPPTDSGQLPTPGPGQQISWGSGLPPDVEKTAKDDPKNPANENKKTTKTETPKADTPPKTDEPPKTTKTSVPNSESGRTDKHPRKAVTVKTRRKKTSAARRTSSSTNEESTGPSVSIGIGLGGMRRGGHDDDRGLRSTRDR
jgi:hypothetical protein